MRNHDFSIARVFDFPERRRLTWRAIMAAEGDVGLTT